MGPSGFRTEDIAFFLYENAEIEQQMMQYLRYEILMEAAAKNKISSDNL